jgi:N-acetylglucosamine-6-sulfatase
MILNADLAPTLLDWAGVDPLPQAQGQSVAAVLAGDRSGVREEFIYEYFPDYPYHVPGMQAVRDDRWLYVEYDTGPAPQLFDVVADPRTQEDLAQRDPAKVAQMAARLGRLRERVEAGEVV